MHRPRPQSSPPSGPPVQLTITTMGAEGEGAATTPDDQRVFVPLTLPGEEVLATFSGERGSLKELIKTSPDRIDPACPHFGTCGGCALQHWAAKPYLDWKQERLRQTLAREHVETEFLEPFITSPGTRRRLSLHARRGPGRDVALLGFKMRRGWDLVPIDTCAVADPVLIAALPGLRRLAACFLESQKSAPTLHVTRTVTGLDVDVTGVEGKNGGLSADGRRRAALEAAACDIARVTLSGETLYQARQPVVAFGPGRVVLPAGGFLQASAAAEQVMAADARQALAGSRKIADLFCGAGAFTFPLAEIAPVTAIDSSTAAIDALRAGIATAPGIKSITPVARDLFRRPLSDKELKGFDGILFDPPRAGAAEQAAFIAASKASTVVGVSCNPATFARDAALLIKGGFRLSRIRPVDQFLWSPHIELVGIFER